MTRVIIHYPLLCCSGQINWYLLKEKSCKNWWLQPETAWPEEFIKKKHDQWVCYNTTTYLCLSYNMSIWPTYNQIHTDTHLHTQSQTTTPLHTQITYCMLRLLPCPRTFYSLCCEHLHRVIKQSRRLNTVNLHLHTGGGTKQINDFLIAVHRSFNLQSSNSNINKSTAQSVFETILGDCKTHSEREEEDASSAFYYITVKILISYSLVARPQL